MIKSDQSTCGIYGSFHVVDSSKNFLVSSYPLCNFCAMIKASSLSRVSSQRIFLDVTVNTDSNVLPCNVFQVQKAKVMVLSMRKLSGYLQHYRS